MIHFKTLRFLLMALVLTPMTGFAQSQTDGASAATLKPEAKLLSLDSGGQEYVRLITPPDSVTMRAGVVTLAPGKSVGKHSTKENEEIVVVLEGEGTMTFAGGKTLALKTGMAAYGPPQTEHDVTNTGKGTLRYIFIVAKAN